MAVLGSEGPESLNPLEETSDPYYPTVVSARALAKRNRQLSTEKT